jgi:hypothetical protein
MIRLVVAVAFISALAPGCAPVADPAGFEHGTTADDPNAAMADVVIQSCQVDMKPSGSAWIKATVVITNSTDRAQSYLATIAVDNTDRARVGEAIVSTHAIPAGESHTLSAVGFAAPNPGQVRCSVAFANRTPSGGT